MCCKNILDKDGTATNPEKCSIHTLPVLFRTKGAWPRCLSVTVKGARAEYSFSKAGVTSLSVSVTDGGVAALSVVEGGVASVSAMPYERLYLSVLVKKMWPLCLLVSLKEVGPI